MEQPYNTVLVEEQPSFNSETQWPRHVQDTVILENFAVVNNSQSKETTKIKNSKILFEQIFTQLIFIDNETTNNRLQRKLNV